MSTTPDSRIAPSEKSVLTRLNRRNASASISEETPTEPPIENKEPTDELPIKEPIEKTDEIINEPIEQSPQDSNDTQPLPEKMPEENISDSKQKEQDSSGSDSGSSDSKKEKQEPKLEVEISSPSQTTRTENFEINAKITNYGGEAKNVILKWILPENFEIISGNQEENCNTIQKNETCISKIKVQTSVSTSLGKNQIKIEVSHK